MLISFHPPITGNAMNSWDLIEILTQKYNHKVATHFDPAFFGDKKPFATVPEAGYQYYLEIVSQGIPNKILVIGNCFGSLTAWESIRHLKKAGSNVLFCGINPAKWIYTKPRNSVWADKYPSPLKEIVKSYTEASQAYEPSAIPEISPYFIIGKDAKVPNEWTGLCPNHKTAKLQELPHSLTRYRFGGAAHLTASLIDEFIKTN